MGLAVLLAALGAGSAQGVGGASVQRELLVGFNPGVSLAEQREVLGRAGASERRRFAKIRAALVSSANEHVLRQLRADPRVRYAEPNSVVHADVLPDDSFYDRLWGLTNTGQPVNGFPGIADADIDADEAWTVTTGRPEVVVAVIDTGVDFAHPDLAPNAWTNQGEDCPGCRSDGIDNDGNGYVDDWRGWDWVNNDGDPTDDNGHGTHVAGTIAAVGNNGAGVAGVAWGVRVMPLKFLAADGNGTAGDAVAAILYAAGEGARVLNNSWSGGEYSQAMRDAIDVADGKGALFVAAAGNDASDNDALPAYPSSFDAPNVISVAATDNFDRRAWFSNVGETSVDLGAPGVDVYSTWPGGGYRFASGTSMAAPHVAGAAALAFSAFPSATHLGVKALLLQTVDPNASLDGLAATNGRLNAARAVTCSGQPQVWVEEPARGFDVDVGTTVSVRALAAACGDPAAVRVSATLNGAPLALKPRGDGLYTGAFTPGAAGAYTVTVTVTAGAATATATATGTASTVYPISAGGGPVTVTSTAPRQALRLAFTGSAGERVSLRLSDSTLGLSTVSILNPDGSPLVWRTYVGSSGGFIDTRTLSVEGKYAIRIEPASDSTGSMTLTLYDVPADATGTLVAGGAPATVTTTVPGQNARLTFDGTAGQRVSIKLSSVTIYASVSIRRPDGVAVGSSTQVGSAGGFMDTRTLPVAGTYSVVVDPQYANTGSMTVILYDVPADVTVALPFAAPLTTSTTVPGQNARLFFDGSSGTRISVALTNVTLQRATISVLRPDGSALGASVYVGPGGAFVDTRTLLVAGRYTIVVDPQADAVGSATVTLHDVPPDATGTIAYSSPATTATTVPGQNARLTFEGTTGRRVSFGISGVSITTSRVSVVGPDGDNLVSILVGTGGAFIDVKTLRADGTYAFVIDPQSTSTGSMTVTLYDVPPDATGTLTLDGPARVVTLATPGQNARLSFEGAVGARLNIKLSAVTISASYVSVLQPDGRTLIPATLVGTFGKTLAVTLSEAGTYKLIVDPRQSATGSVSVTLGTAP